MQVCGYSPTRATAHGKTPGESGSPAAPGNDSVLELDGQTCNLNAVGSLANLLLAEIRCNSAEPVHEKGNNDEPEMDRATPGDGQLDPRLKAVRS